MSSPADRDPQARVERYPLPTGRLGHETEELRMDASP
jgi:hypothetical protein